MTSMRPSIVLGCALLGVVYAQLGAIQVAEGLSPRYYFGSSDEIQKRQAGVCQANEHSCLDINSTSVCCKDSEYCVINTDYSPGCCAIGSNCNLPCSSKQYQCATTTTISGKATVSPACCARSCNVSSYKCAAALGGGCCAFGFECQSGGKCASTVPPTTTNKAVATDPPVVGCAAEQISCAADVGGGCCGISSTCTVSDNGYYCAAASQTAQRTGADGSTGTGLSKTTKHSGLSSGAKAGIGGGIAGIVLILVGGVVYFCLRQRRNNRAKSVTTSAPEMSQKSGSGATKPKPSPIRRQTADYFGPTATAGPYTDEIGTLGTSPGANKGVPMSPQGPYDIATPVEIDSRDHSNVTSPGQFVYEKVPDVKEYPFELP